MAASSRASFSSREVVWSWSALITPEKSEMCVSVCEKLMFGASFSHELNVIAVIAKTAIAVKSFFI